MGPTTRYAIAVGSNRRGLHGAPEMEVRAALDLLGGTESRIVASAPLGPSARRFANAVVLVESDLAPPAMLAHLKAIERDFGRRPAQRWGARVIDLDIVFWSGGVWSDAALTIPHIALRERDFVLTPLATIAPDWRDPLTRRSVRQLRALLTRRRPLS